MGQLIQFPPPEIEDTFEGELVVRIIRYRRILETLKELNELMKEPEQE